MTWNALFLPMAVLDSDCVDSSNWMLVSVKREVGEYEQILLPAASRPAGWCGKPGTISAVAS